MYKDYRKVHYKSVPSLRRAPWPRFAGPLNYERYKALRAAGAKPVAIAFYGRGRHEDTKLEKILRGLVLDNDRGSLDLSDHLSLNIRIEPDDILEETTTIERSLNNYCYATKGVDCIAVYTSEQMEHIGYGHRPAGYYWHIHGDESPDSIYEYWHAQGFSRNDADLLRRGWIRAETEMACYYERHPDELQRYVVFATIFSSGVALGHAAIGGVGLNDDGDPQQEIIDIGVVTEALDEALTTIRELASTNAAIAQEAGELINE